MNKSSKRTSKRLVPNRSIYVGIEIEGNVQTGHVALGLYSHDGFCGIEFTDASFSSAQFEYKNPTDFSSAQQIYDHFIFPLEPQILDWLHAYSEGLISTKIQVAGLGIQVDGWRISPKGFGLCWNRSISNSLSNFKNSSCQAPISVPILSRLWHEFDILPIMVCTETTGSIDERACSAVRKALNFINPHIAANIPRISVGFRHRVEVDGNGFVRFSNLDDYENFTSPSAWNALLHAAQVDLRN